MYRRQYVNRARHVVNAFEREGSIKRAKLGQCLACRDDETCPISNAGRFSVRVRRLDRGFIEVKVEGLHRAERGGEDLVGEFLRVGGVFNARSAR